MDNDVPIRINSGGNAYTDSAGNQWSTDYGFVQSSGTFASTQTVLGSNELPLHTTERFGTSLSYNIPVVNGTYDVNLSFIENKILRKRAIASLMSVLKTNYFSTTSIYGLSIKSWIE